MCELAKLDVCFIAGTLGQGGAERQLFYIMKALHERGTKVRLLCLTKGEFWEKRIIDLGIPVTWVGQQGSRAMRLARIIKEVRSAVPDVLQSQHFYTNLYAAAAARALRVREIGAVRNDGYSEVRSAGSVLGRLSLRLPRLLAANSKAGIRNAMALGVPSSRLQFLPNVVDTDWFKPAPMKNSDGQGGRAITLLAIGRLEEQKRFDRFISIVARLHRTTSFKIRGVIVGDGPLRAKLERQATELGLMPDVIEMKGAVTYTFPLYHTADILMLTSDWEGTPNVILEAMASGLPVLATAVGGVPDLVQNGETGWLSVAGDEDSMFEAAMSLIRDAGLRKNLGSRGRAYVIANHSHERLPAMLQDVYQVALS